MRMVQSPEKCVNFKIRDFDRRTEKNCHQTAIEDENFAQLI